jgi:dTDP-4-dehydrorhamnose reductase
MKVLILGAGGMLGHKVWQVFRDRFDCRATLRARPPLPIFDDDRVIDGVDATDFEAVKTLIETISPAVVVNCVGVVKQLAAAHDPITSITLNALFPHIVARACEAVGARLIHISTDCVFSGLRGNYTESAPPDPTDLYGRSKLLGEVTASSEPKPLTIRTSIIGRELRTSNGLVEWFLANRGGFVRGFARAVFSGVTTTVFAGMLADVIEHHSDLHGLYHVAAAPVSKYDLLLMVNEAIAGEVTITADESVVIDRSLDASRFQTATGILPPSWPEMIATLAAESPQYDRWRKA